MEINVEKAKCLVNNYQQWINLGAMASCWQHDLLDNLFAGWHYRGQEGHLHPAHPKS